MSHKIIINNKAAPASGETHVHGLEEYSITYSPDHGMTEAQVGQKVAKILKIAKKLDTIDAAADAA